MVLQNKTHSLVLITAAISDYMLKRTLFILQQLAKEGQDHYLHDCANKREKHRVLKCQ